MTSKPNILLITTDQQRYDTLGCNGNALVQTPHIDALAVTGARFEYAYCNNPVCIPSRACIQTGRYTHQHGVRYMENRVNDTPGLPWWERTFMERLQDAGYDTGGFGKIHMFPPRGFSQAQLTNGQGARWKTPYGSEFGPAQLGDDYAYWLEHKRPGAYEEIYRQRRTAEYDQYLTAVTSVLEYDETVDYWAAQNTIGFVREERRQPFFAWLGFCNPHGPLDAPRRYAEMYRPEDIVLSEKYLRRPDPEKGPSEDIMRRWIAHYYGLCSMIDDLLGEVFDVLKQSGQWENTLIIFTSDHGEMMGELGKFGKGNFSEPVIRVPLVVKEPQSKQRGQTISTLTELIDLAPTMLDYADVTAPSTIQGNSLMPLLKNNDYHKEQILCEYLTNDRQRHGKCIRTERYKYELWSPGGEEKLYDLQEDPGEWRDMAQDQKYFSLLGEMRKRLARHLMESEKPVLF
jgi:arylsulfatase A-like enzyme